MDQSFSPADSVTDAELYTSQSLAPSTLSPHSDDMGAESGKCGFTILRARTGCYCTKQWSWDASRKIWAKTSYSAGLLFTVEEVTFTSLKEMAVILDKLRGDSKAFVVRGKLLPDVKEKVRADPAATIYRLKKENKGRPPTLAEVPRRWLMIDVDDWPLPPWADLAGDPGPVIKAAVRELLPVAFHDVQCWWQLSSSAGFEPGVLKVHIYFWLTNPTSNDHVKRVLKDTAPGVDLSPFNAVQPHYIANPIIVGGPDPIRQRVGWLPGTRHAVDLPDPSQPKHGREASAGISRSGSIRNALANLGDGDGLGGFHSPLRTLAMEYARSCARYGGRDDSRFKAELLAAIASAPTKAGRDKSGYGEEYLQSSIDGAFQRITSGSGSHSTTPFYSAPVDDVKSARQKLERHVHAFLARTARWHELSPENRANSLAEQLLLSADVGVGKSLTTHHAIRQFIQNQKAAGLPHRILYLVPEHGLAAQTELSLSDTGLSVAVWRGREARAPILDCSDGPETHDSMCWDIPAVQAAIEARLSVETAVCGSGLGGERSCIYRHDCAYQRQKTTAAAADVLIASHNFLFCPLPEAVERGLALVIVDESWWQVGLSSDEEARLEGFGREPQDYPVRRQAPGLGSYAAPVDEGATNDLHTWSTWAQSAFSTIAAGDFVSREALVNAGITADICATAAKLERRRRVDNSIQPNMAPAERAAGVKRAAGNAMADTRAGIWNATRLLLEGSESHTGRLQVSMARDRRGSDRVILLLQRKPIRDEVAGLPMLLLDAALTSDLVKWYLPRVTILDRVTASAPNMRLHQVTGSWGKRRLVGSLSDTPEQRKASATLISELQEFVRHNAEGDALVVTYKDLEARFEGDHVQTAHFNAVAGLNKFEKVKSGFVIGKPLPAPQDLRALALALTGRPIPTEEPVVEERGALMEGGGAVGVSIQAYADPDLEALRAAICLGEIVQAAGRVRGVNRTAETPVNVYVFANEALPLPLASIDTWANTRLNALSSMGSRGVVLLSPKDAASAYPDLFPSPDAARMAIKRIKDAMPFPNTPLEESLIKGVFGKYAAKVTYRPEGAGQQTRQAWVAVGHMGDVRRWLEGVCGRRLSVFSMTPRGSVIEHEKAALSSIFELFIQQSSRIRLSLPFMVITEDFPLALTLTVQAVPFGLQYLMLPNPTAQLC